MKGDAKEEEEKTTRSRRGGGTRAREGEEDGRGRGWGRGKRLLPPLAGPRPSVDPIRGVEDGVVTTFCRTGAAGPPKRVGKAER